MSKRPVVVEQGPALNTPDADLDLLALISVEDIEAAQTQGRQATRRRGRQMLATERAEEPEEDEAG